MQRSDNDGDGTVNFLDVGGSTLLGTLIASVIDYGREHSREVGAIDYYHDQVPSGRVDEHGYHSRTMDYHYDQVPSGRVDDHGRQRGVGASPVPAARATPVSAGWDSAHKPGTCHRAWFQKNNTD